uniref:Uncharacterized protein n=1 Tax=Octactis speculum TaxID=3111310 RepID=A0A7S2MB54_9STRA|mmetsp:Transcript_58751/g.80146  ORF Transcript_58751/g.80146 Transcript_58751/m.80146 type:complete len:133 (+) Transcript_58751:640-1038(+)
MIGLHLMGYTPCALGYAIDGGGGGGIMADRFGVESAAAAAAALPRRKQGGGSGSSKSASEERPRTVGAMLEANGWSFKRRHKHMVYQRMVLFEDGREQRQVYSASSTPSDWRASRNQLAKLRGLNDGVIEVS